MNYPFYKIAFSTVLVALLLLDGSSAFMTQKAVSSQAVWGTSLREGTQLRANPDDMDVFLLLGRNQLKNTARKNKRKANQGAPKLEKQAPKSKVSRKASVGDALRIIIAGAPASGKGTQCEMIKTKYGIIHLSTGDMLRAAVAAGTKIGNAAKEYMDSGKLVPDEVIIGVVKDRLENEDCKTKGWLLDGFPRTQAQAVALADAGISADCFLFLNVPDEVLVERVVGRRTDPETGKIYHMTFSPPQDNDVRFRLVQRSDDTEEKVKVRLEQFHANVEAVKGSYSEISVDIDGTKSPQEVASSIDLAIKAKIGKTLLRK